MHNMVYLIGRLARDVKGKDLTLAVARSCKNKDGIYETDFIECELLGAIVDNVKEYCRKGDLVGIKGCLRSGNKVIIEKITFLASRKKHK